MPLKLSPFSQWALDDARTTDERYLIYLVCEACRLIEHHRQPLEYQRQNFYQSVRQEMWKTYYLNPLLMPPFSSKDTERAAAMTPWFKKFAPDCHYEKRRIGDAGAVLRFFPALEELTLHGTRLKDLSFLTELPNLRKLQLSGGEMEDLDPLKHCGSLRELSLGLSGGGPPTFTPPLYWVDGRPLGALPQLESLTLYPNPAILSGLRFPLLKKAEFEGGNVMQRDCDFLPDMPKLRLLKLTGVQSLRGISRFPELRHLRVGGALRDFGDIGELRQLDCLEVDTAEGWPRDLVALTELPNLLWVRFGGEIPRNYWPLAQAPRLCELVVAQCPPVQLDVQAINAVLPAWDTIFSMPGLRARPPLRFVAIAIGGDMSVLPKNLPEPGPDFLEHPKLFNLELVWMHHRALAAARKVTGDDDSIGSTIPHETNWERTGHIEVQTIEAAQRFPEILEAVREAMAASPHPWHFCISVGLRIKEMEMTEQQKKWLREIKDGSNRWDDERDFERYTLTKSHIIETEFRLRMSKEEGEAPDPEDFVPPEEISPGSHRRASLVPATPQSDGSDDTAEDNPDFKLKPFDEQEQNSDDGNDDGDDGKVTTAPPPDPPPSFLDDPYAHPLADSYRFYATLTFDAFYHHGHNLATVQQLMGRGPDEYHPGPPGKE